MTTGVAWYDLQAKGLGRDCLTILHLPYTLWNLAYVAIGAALAPVLNLVLLGWIALAFFLGMGIAAHTLDELHGRPLKTSFPSWLLWTVAIIALVGTAIIAFTMARELGPWIWLFWSVAVWGTLAYNLEAPRWAHTDPAFALLWGAFPLITAYWVQTGTLDWRLVFPAFFAYLLSRVQRVLSTRSRLVRRRMDTMDAGMKVWTLAPVDSSLRLLNSAVVVLAIGLLVMRL